jgi:hypothetical protein
VTVAGLPVHGSLGVREGWPRAVAVTGSFSNSPIEPAMRSSRTPPTDALHRRYSTGARQGRFGGDDDAVVGDQAEAHRGPVDLREAPDLIPETRQPVSST